MEIFIVQSARCNLLVVYSQRKTLKTLNKCVIKFPLILTILQLHKSTAKNSEHTESTASHSVPEVCNTMVPSTCLSDFYGCSHLRFQ